MDYALAIPGQQVGGSQSLSAYLCGRSLATRVRHSESESSAAQNVENSPKRIGVDISINANASSTAKIDLDQAGLLLGRAS
jgi:hypothetical protein